MLGLGRLYDIVPIVLSVDADASTPGGRQLSLRDAGGVDFVVCGKDATSDDIAITIKQHVDLNDATGKALALGSNAAGSALPYSYKQEHASAIGSVHTWTRTAFGDADGVFTISGSANNEGVYVYHVDARSLDTGYSSVSFTLTDAGSTGTKYVTVLAILTDIRSQRSPENLRSATS